MAASLRSFSPASRIPSTGSSWAEGSPAHPRSFSPARTDLHQSDVHTAGEKAIIALTAILSSLIILTHPETALYTLVAALVFFLFYGRNKRGLLRSTIVILFTLAPPPPGGISVLGAHGISIFGIAGSTGDYNWESFQEFLLFDLTGERTLPMVRVLAIIGLIQFLVKRSFFLPVMLVALYFSDPRSANRVLAPILAIFAACCDCSTSSKHSLQTHRATGYIREMEGSKKWFRVGYHLDQLDHDHFCFC